MTLGAHMCKWPIGDPADAAFGFCGHATHEGAVYCAEHARVAFQPAKKRERRAREFDYIQRLAGHGLIDELDVIAVHGFPLDWNLWNINEWPQRIEEIQAVVPNHELWVTEVGVGSFGAEEVQEFGVKRTAELLIGKVPRIFWYSLYDLPQAWGATPRHREAEGGLVGHHLGAGPDGAEERVLRSR